MGARRTILLGATAVAGLSLLAAACGNAKSTSSSGSNGGSTAPGVTATSITVGSIVDKSGIDSSDFSAIASGVQAYFSTVNAQGGVNGRKLSLPSSNILDDGGLPTGDTTAAQELVQQKSVFAVVGVASPFFSGATFLTQQGTPTFGYAVSTDWAPGTNLFGSYGSYLGFDTAVPGYAYIANQLKSTSVAILAYAVPQSAAACEAADTGLRKLGVNVSFVDTKLFFGTDPTADVLQMKAHHVDMVFSCLDVSGNVAFARSIAQNSLGTVNQIWLNGYDRTTLQQDSQYMKGVYFSVQHVPFEAASLAGSYPGLQSYLTAMAKYQPADTYNESALAGWVSADQFVTGLKAVGPDLTQKALIDAINSETAFTGDGLTTPTNWTVDHTSAGPGPYCAAVVGVSGSKFTLAFTNGNQVFRCFTLTSATPVAAPAGTPGS